MHAIFYQWDQNQRIILGDECPNPILRVDFSADNDRSQEALSVTPYERNGVLTADVPNKLLWYAGRIQIYLYCEDDGRQFCRRYGMITVLPREKPTDYVYTETELLSYRTLAEKLKVLEEGGLSGGTGGMSKTAAGLLVSLLQSAVYREDISDTLDDFSALLDSEAGSDDNTGDDNTGGDNTGGDNTGDDNTGGDNTGGDNTGGDNTGGDNTGGDNTGDDNTGDDNTGGDNTGDDNTDETYEIKLVAASVTAASGTPGVYLGNVNNGQRATLLRVGGSVTVPMDSGAMSEYSLIPIPRDTACITVCGDAAFTFGLFFFALVDGVKYEVRHDSGWMDMTAARQRYDIPAAYADGSHCLAINYKLDTGAVFALEDYSDTLTVMFGDTTEEGGNSGTGEEEDEPTDGTVAATLVSASVTGSSGTGAELGNWGLNQRATLLTTGGDIKLTIPATGETSDYSLIPIPAGAAALEVTATKDFHFGVSVFAVENGAKYVQQLDSGWMDITGDTDTYAIGTYAIPADYTDGTYALSVNFRLDSYGSFAAEDYREIIKAKFTYAE